MNVRKIFAVIFACAIVMCSLTACGGSNTETTDNSETGVVAETTDETSSENNNTNESVDNDENDSEKLSADTASFTGTYSPKTIIDADGNQTAYDEYVKLAAAEQGYEEGTDEYDSFIASAETSYEFKDDGTVTATLGEETKEGTYEYDGSSTLNTTLSGVTTQYEYDSATNTLTATDTNTGMTVVMEAV